uniref:Uncharacterized protein n=1 Tax=Roseihalotalea indica TaxID=2867963 RepID=A0AA49GKC2_9BACT|nr:hypothetical protein K4G66_21490 [Tunicatimonas sp. TK19036]
MSLHCKIVDQNEFAFTARCARSGQLQLGFGNIALLMEPKEFLRLKDQVANTLTTVSQPCCPYRRDIVVDTSVTNMAFVFSLADLSLLHEVMQTTTILLEAQNILKTSES